MTEKKPEPAPFAIVSDDGTVTPLTGGFAEKVATAIAPLATVFDKKTKRAAKPRVKPRVASKGDAIAAPVKPGDAAPPKPSHGSVPRIHEVERDISEPKLRVPPMPERLSTDTDVSYNARIAKWAVNKDKARIAHEARLRAYHAGPKVRVEQVASWTRNPTAPALSPRRPLVGTIGVGHMTTAPLSFEDKVTRLCVGLLRAETAPPPMRIKGESDEDYAKRAAAERPRLETQILKEVGHDVVVAANREGMVSGKRLTEEGREHALASVDDFQSTPLKPVEVVVSPETTACPICGHVIADFRAHVMAQHVYPDRERAEKAPAKKAPARKKAPAKKAPEKKAAKKTAEPKAKKPRAKKSNPEPRKEEVHGG